jgi:putative transposase
MARIARVVVPGCPHHITQRGNRGLQTFFRDDDYRAYLDLLAHWSRQYGVEVWAYCLMPNHVHIIAVPSSEDALRLAFGKAHLRYTRRINFRENWRGHLWQGRFSSFALDEHWLWNATRYIALNPVRAGLAERPEDWPWSSARAHKAGRDDILVNVEPILTRVENWEEFISQETSPDILEQMRRHERTGRPAGGESFLKRLSQALGRDLVPKKPGRRPKETRK